MLEVSVLVDLQLQTERRDYVADETVETRSSGCNAVRAEASRRSSNLERRTLALKRDRSEVPGLVRWRP